MIQDKHILIIGGTGSLGNYLTERYIHNNNIYIYSRGENNQWIMKNKFNNDNLHFFIGDIRDSERLKTCLFRFKPNIIIIAAALKHIDICEDNINECINTNVDGIRNIIDLISTYAMIGSINFLETVLFVSTDKACAPVNAYGMCKAISERVIVEKTKIIDKPKFINVRYGNVLLSRGSLIPKFNEIGQDNTKTSFDITSIDMTRFFMTLEESANLIEYALLHGQSGDTIIPKYISSYRIYDIAKYFADKYNKDIRHIGIRPGEKLYEELISFTESLRTVERDNYYIIKPVYTIVDNHINLINEFNPSGTFNSKQTSNLDNKILEAINNNF